MLTLHPLGLRGQVVIALDPPYMTMAHECETCRKEVPSATDNRPVWAVTRAGKPTRYFCDSHYPGGLRR